MPQKVAYKLSVMVHHCLNATAPHYLSELCTLVADVASRRQLLRSVCQSELTVSRQNLSSAHKPTCIQCRGPVLRSGIIVRLHVSA